MKINQWETKQLDDVATFSSGGTPSKEEANYWEGDYPWISAKDMKCFSIKDAGLKLTPEGLAVAKIAKKGSVLVLVRGMTLLKDLPVGYVERDVAFNQDIKALVAKSGVLGLFLAYALIANKNRILNLVNVAGHGTGRLDTTLLKEFPIDLPPLSEQCKIAEMLGVWDESIDLLERLVGKTRSRKQGLMQQLLTGKKHFKEFEGSEWKENRLADLADVIDPHPSHRAPKEYLDGIPFIGIGDISENGDIDFSKVRKVHPSIADEHAKAYIVQEGDIAFGRVASIGKVIKLKVTFFKYTISPTMALIKPTSNIASSFLQYALQSTTIGCQISALTNGSTRQSLGIMNLRELIIVTPPLPEQEKIAAVLAAADEEREHVNFVRTNELNSH